MTKIVDTTKRFWTREWFQIATTVVLLVTGQTVASTIHCNRFRYKYIVTIIVTYRIECQICGPLACSVSFDTSQKLIKARLTLISFSLMRRGVLKSIVL